MQSSGQTKGSSTRGDRVCGSGSGSGLWRGSGWGCGCGGISPRADCWMLCCTGSKTHPRTHWGQATWWNQCQSPSASSQHPRVSSSSKRSAGSEQSFILVCTLLFVLTRGLVFMVYTQTQRHWIYKTIIHYHSWWLVVFLSINCWAMGGGFLYPPYLAPCIPMHNHRVPTVVLFLLPDLSIAKYKATNLTEYVPYCMLLSL